MAYDTDGVCAQMHSNEQHLTHTQISFTCEFHSFIVYSHITVGENYGNGRRWLVAGGDAATAEMRCRFDFHFPPNNRRMAPQCARIHNDGIGQHGTGTHTHTHA